MVHGASYNIKTCWKNTTNLVCKLKFKVSATNAANFQPRRDPLSTSNMFLKNTVKSLKGIFNIYYKYFDVYVMRLDHAELCMF